MQIQRPDELDTPRKDLTLHSVPDKKKPWEIWCLMDASWIKEGKKMTYRAGRYETKARAEQALEHFMKQENSYKTTLLKNWRSDWKLIDSRVEKYSAAC